MVFKQMGWAVFLVLIGTALGWAKELRLAPEVPGSIEEVLVQAGWGAIPFGSSVVQQKGAEDFVIPAYAELNEAFDALRQSMQRLAASLGLVLQAAHNLKADTGLELSQTCQLRAFLSRAKAIEQSVGSAARWMPDSAELKENISTVRSRLSGLRQLPNAASLFTENHWNEIRTAEDLIEVGDSISPTQLTPGTWVAVEQCPLSIRMQRGEDMRFSFDERLEALQSKPRKYFSMLNERYRLVQSLLISVDIDGTHTTRVISSLEFPLR